MALPKGSKAALVVMAVAALATIAYWVIWFFVDRKILASADTSEYYVFENSFVLADAWMTLASLLGIWGLLKRKDWSVLWMLVGGGSSIYLGCMDVLFDLQNGIYKAPTGDWGGVIIEILINLFCLLGGAYIISFAWKNRDALLAKERPAG